MTEANRRTFNLHRDVRHNHYHPTSSSTNVPSTTVPFTPSPTSLYYFKPADNSPKPTASIQPTYKNNGEKDNIAVASSQDYLPKYVVYPSSTPSTPQKYLKHKTFHPVGSYDAPTTSKSIYREETSGLKHGKKKVKF